MQFSLITLPHTSSPSSSKVPFNLNSHMLLEALLLLNCHLPLGVFPLQLASRWPGLIITVWRANAYWVLGMCQASHQALYIHYLNRCRMWRQPGLASWVCDMCSHTGLCAEEGPSLGLMLCCWYLEILHQFWIRDLHFHFSLGPANYVACPEKT